MPESSAEVPATADALEPDAVPWVPMPPAMIDVDQLTAHPGNVRTDLRLLPEFLASVAETGVRIPLLVVPEGDGYKVVEGHRRLAAAVQVGLAQVPCILDLTHVGDAAGQFLDMLVANSGGYRQNFTAVQEAAALFAAHEAGASRTRIRKATGRKADEVRTALRVGAISQGTLGSAGELAGELSLDQLALLAEFDGDPEAVETIITALRRGYGAEYTAERIREDRAETAEHQRLRAELAANGVPVTSELPEGAMRLTALTNDGEDVTPETHLSCPGRGAFFFSWSPLDPIHYCASPVQYGHTVPEGSLQPVTADAPPAAADAASDAAADTPPDPDRKLVIEGNNAWRAANEVRKRWLASELFARRTAPRQAAPFIARQLLSMPDPVRSGLAGAASRMLFSEVTGHEAGHWLEGCDTSMAGRLPLLMLGPIVTAYEQAMSEGEGTSTWRTDRYSPCPHAEAGRYLAFLASIGYPLSVIEQAVADGISYTGDIPTEPEPTDPSATGDDGDAGEAADPAPAEDDRDAVSTAAA